MAKTQIAGSRIGTIKNLKKTLKASGGGPLSWIPKEGITVRFLTEPDDWFGFYEHYDDSIRKSYPCVEGDCPGCATDAKRTFRYLANVLDIENDKVKALLLPKSLANRLTARYERNDTLMDRDYELFKTGEGLDTEYDLNPEAPKRRGVSKYEQINLEDALQKAWDAVWGDEDDEDEDEKPRKSRRSRGASAAKSRKSRTRDEDDDEDEDDEEEDEDDEDDEVDESLADTIESIEDLEDLKLPDLKEIAEELGLSTDPDKGKKRVSSAQLRERIIDELGLDEDEDEEDDEYDDEDEDFDDDVEDDDDDEDDDEDDEYEEYTEDELASFSTAELREIARDYDIKTVKKKKADLIEAILEIQE